MDSTALLAVLPALRRHARALVGDPMAADDLVQDTLERAWRHAHRWDAERGLRPWLLTIMHHVRIDQWRRQGLDLVNLDEADAGLPVMRATQTDGLEMAALEAALQQVPEPQRAVMLLVAIEGCSYAEVAEMLGVPTGTVMSRLARGRDRLRQLLAEQATPSRLRLMK